MKSRIGTLTLPQEVSQRYRLLEIVGSGAEGAVYRAVDRRLHRIVALKVYTSPGDRYTENAAIAAARLFHPGIVATLDVFWESGTLVLVQEFIEGRSLAQRSPAVDHSTVSILSRVATAMEYCHRTNLAHRDLKCSNVMLANSGFLKIVDFGLAKDFSSDALMTRSIDGLRQVGTLAYMAPEVVYDRFRLPSDVWSFGAMALRCFFGRYPYSARTLYGIMAEMKEIIDGRSSKRLKRAFDGVQDNFGADLGAALAACLEAEPNDRPSFGDLSKMLSRVSAGLA